MTQSLEPGTQAHRLIGASLRAVANLFPLTAPDPAEGHLISRCIETSRVLIEVLRHYDLPAKPMPVDINICNPEWYRQVNSGVRDISSMPDQAWSLGVNAEGRGPRSTEQRLMGARGWNGHLIVQSGRRWMMDPNAGQFNRPGRIRMPRSWMWPYPKEKWQQDKTAWDFFGMGSDGITPDHPEYALIYIRNRPDNIGYKQGSAWGSPLIPLFAEQIVDLLDRLQAGTLPDRVDATKPGDDEPMVVDVTLLKQRWNEEAPA